jgi:multidrug efflux pump subunit AcrB
MWLFGFSINVLTLLAIVLATGLVDDGIVVTENILKSRRGMTPIEASKALMRSFAVISISITLASSYRLYF